MLLHLKATIKSGLLKRFRERRQLTQKDAAEMAGVTTANWNSVECLRFKSVSWDVIRKVASLLEVEPEQIVPEHLKDATKDMWTREQYIERRLLDDSARKTAARLELPSPDGDSKDGPTVEQIKAALDGVLDSLTYREREIIKLRYGIGDGYACTLEECGKIFKVSRDRVRQIEATAIRKLQHPVRANKLLSLTNGAEG